MNKLTKPVGKFYRDCSGATVITTSAWVVLDSSVDASCSALEIFNGTGCMLKLSTGGASAEDASELPYYIIPGGSSSIIPLELTKGARLSAKAVDTDTVAGLLIINSLA